MQEAEQGPVDVQRVGAAEAGVGEQGEDVLERTQGARGPQRERCGQGPCAVEAWAKEFDSERTVVTVPRKGVTAGRTVSGPVSALSALR